MRTSGGSCVRTRLAETRTGSSESSLASRSSTRRCWCAMRRVGPLLEQLGRQRPAPSRWWLRSWSGPPPRASWVADAEAIVVGRFAASNRVPMDVTGVAPTPRVADASGLSVGGLPATIGLSPGLPTSGRAGGIGAENAAVRRSGTGRRSAAGSGWARGRLEPSLSRSRSGTSRTGTHRSWGKGEGGNVHIAPDAPGAADEGEDGLREHAEKQMHGPQQERASTQRRRRARTHHEQDHEPVEERGQQSEPPTTEGVGPRGGRLCPPRTPGPRSPRSSPPRSARTSASCGFPRSSRVSSSLRPQATFSRSGSVFLT